MANKPRKMLSDKNAPCTRLLLQLIEAQDKRTVCKWCLDYAEAQFLPIFECRYPSKWHALAVYFYGAAAIAYDRIGLNERTEVYDAIAEEVCADRTAALQATANKGV